MLGEVWGNDGKDGEANEMIISSDIRKRVGNNNSFIVLYTHVYTVYIYICFSLLLHVIIIIIVITTRTTVPSIYIISMNSYRSR